MLIKICLREGGLQNLTPKLGKQKLISRRLLKNLEIKTNVVDGQKLRYS